MQLVVGVPPHYWASVFFGCAVLLLCDGLWFLGTYNCLYAACIKSPRRQSVRVACVVCYALVASVVASTVTAATDSEAAFTGALLGMIVFFTFNVTTYGISSDYDGCVAIIDTLYGTIAWTVLLVVQHRGAEIADWLNIISI